MSHKLSLDGNSMAISYWQVYELVYTGLSNSMAQSMELRCCVLNKVFLINHWRDILNCSYKWLRFSSSHKCKG